MTTLAWITDKERRNANEIEGARHGPSRNEIFVDTRDC